MPADRPEHTEPEFLDGWAASEDRREAALTIDVEGFEGPLDLLLELARRQKVDLTKISILALAEQYLAFVEEVRRLRIEIAADYLVMAAWLAFLKSKLLLPDPEPEGDEPSGEALAAMLAFRLRRLEAMRDVGARLMNRNKLGRDFFARGNPEPIQLEKRSEYSATLYDLLTAYAEQRQIKAAQHVTINRRAVWSLAEARTAILRFADEFCDWTALDHFLMHYLPEFRAEATERNSIRASSFAAVLELVREGRLVLRQEEAYAPIYLRQQGDSQSEGTIGHSGKARGG